MSSENINVLVAGATGGVGQLVVAKLLDQQYSVRVLVRDRAKAEKLFGDRVEMVIGDIRQPETLPPAMAGINAVIAATGTTAFPSERWQFESEPEKQGVFGIGEWLKLLLDKDYRDRTAQNSPQIVDADGIAHLVNAASDLRRFVFVSSCGISRKDEFPFNLLNAFGVLDAKAQGEAAIQVSGLPYTIIRPARLIDGPFTSYDLNTLLQAKTNGDRGVVLGTGDQLNGDTSRIDVAAACVACLTSDAAANQIFEMVNRGDRPAEIDWPALFETLA
ncbi:MAG: SDR family oxidoreductase [Cyanobacteria bacterium P01_H01_bin.119]